MMKNRSYNIKGVTLDMLNPSNIALKNDFNHNLHSLMFYGIPTAFEVLGDMTIVKGMTSDKQNKKNNRTSFLDKLFSSGNAVTVESVSTCCNVSTERNIQYVIDNLSLLLKNLTYSYSYIIANNQITIYKSPKPQLLESVDEELQELRVIYSE